MIRAVDRYCDDGVWRLTVLRDQADYLTVLRPINNAHDFYEACETAVQALKLGEGARE